MKTPKRIPEIQSVQYCDPYTRKNPYNSTTLLVQYDF